MESNPTRQKLVELLGKLLKEKFDMDFPYEEHDKFPVKTMALDVMSDKAIYYGLLYELMKIQASKKTVAEDINLLLWKMFENSILLTKAVRENGDFETAANNVIMSVINVIAELVPKEQPKLKIDVKLPTKNTDPY